MEIVLICTHPDDEALVTGALAAWLITSRHEMSSLTTTRGERGKVVSGLLSHPAETSAPETHREGELAGVLKVLGMSWHAFLGDPPAGSGHRCRDSRMRWIREGLVESAEDVEPDSLCAANLDDVMADIASWIRTVDADLVVSHHTDGGYGHLDHVRIHHTPLAAVQRTGKGFTAVVHNPGDGVRWFNLRDL